VGITEESDAVVVVVSEETSTISVVYAGEMVRDLDGPRLREVLREILTGGKLERPGGGDEAREGGVHRVTTPAAAAGRREA
jgi:hypothetical protein